MSRKLARKDRDRIPPPFSNAEIRENRESADMVRLPDTEWRAVQDGPPGGFCYRSLIAPDGTGYMCMYCKLPDGSTGSVVLHPVPPAALPLHTHEDGKVHAWTLRGDPDRPTLVPSVWLKGRWHGHFKCGRMVSL